MSRTLRVRAVDPVLLTEAMLTRVAEVNPGLSSYLSITPESALSEAEQARRELAEGRWRGPLHGVPVAI
jgi:amidase